LDAEEEDYGFATSNLISVFYLSASLSASSTAPSAGIISLKSS